MTITIEYILLKKIKEILNAIEFGHLTEDEGIHFILNLVDGDIEFYAELIKEKNNG